MIIEFFGFPGSGKTTICNRFVKKLKIDNRKVVRGTFDHLTAFERVSCKLFHSFLCFFISPIFYIKNILSFLGVKNGAKLSFSDFLNVTYLYARYSLFKNTDKIVVFDQGVIQAYWSILIFSKRGKEYDYHRLFKNVDKVIVLEMDLEQNLDRLFSREDKSSRVQKETEDMDFYYEEFLKVKEVLNELDIPYRLSLDSAKKVKKNVKKIRNRIVRDKVGNAVLPHTDD